jgi:hypothetical protein
MSIIPKNGGQHRLTNSELLAVGLYLITEHNFQIFALAAVRLPRRRNRTCSTRREATY